MANTKEGWVEEHMGGSKWAKSYIVLQSNFLLLFSKPPGGLHKPRTKVDVTSCYVLRKDDFRQNTFALSPKDKNKKAYFFSAPDRQTAEEWMDAIKTQQMPLPKPSAPGPTQNPYMPRKTSAGDSDSGPAHNPYMPRSSTPGAASPERDRVKESMYPSPVMSSTSSPYTSSHSAPVAAVPIAGGGSFYQGGGGAYHPEPVPYGAQPVHAYHGYAGMHAHYQYSPTPPHHGSPYYQQAPAYAQHPQQPIMQPPMAYHPQAHPSLAAYPQHHSSPALFGAYPSSLGAPPPHSAAAYTAAHHTAAGPGPAYPTQAAPRPF